jgi:hypothetical protein
MHRGPLGITPDKYTRFSARQRLKNGGVEPGQQGNASAVPQPSFHLILILISIKAQVWALLFRTSFYSHVLSAKYYIKKKHRCLFYCRGFLYNAVKKEVLYGYIDAGHVGRNRGIFDFFPGQGQAENRAGA